MLTMPAVCIDCRKPAAPQFEDAWNKFQGVYLSALGHTPDEDTQGLLDGVTVILNAAIAVIARQGIQLDNCHETIADLQRYRFGRSTETTVLTAENAGEQMALEAMMSQGSNVPPTGTETVVVAAHTRKKKLTNAERYSNLPVIPEYTHKIPEDQQDTVFLIDGKPMLLVGYRSVRQEVRSQPSQNYIADIQTPVFVEIASGEETALDALSSFEPVDESSEEFAELLLKALNIDEIIPPEKRRSPGLVIPQVELAEEERLACGGIVPRKGYIERVKGVRALYTLPSPQALLEGCEVSPSLMARIICMKYVDCLPTYRIERIFWREGYSITRATLCRWLIRVASERLWKLYELMIKILRMLYILHMDETWWQVHREPGKSNTSESRAWVYVSGKSEKYQMVIFDYEPDRNGDRAVEMIGDIAHLFHVDGFGGYNKVKGIRVGCWAHTRRKFFEAMPQGTKVKNSSAAAVVKLIDKLFRLESKWKDLTPNERLAMRKQHSAPIVDEIYDLIRSLRPAKGSKLEIACTYALNQEESLRVFLDYGEAELSNNAAENEIRPFVIGRKNWMFSDSPEGAASTALYYSLIGTAKKNFLDPRSYLEVVLTRLMFLGPDPSEEELLKLLPWSDEMQASVAHLHDFRAVKTEATRQDPTGIKVRILQPGRN